MSQGSAKQVVELTDYLFTLPRARYSFVLIILTGILFGIIIRFLQGYNGSAGLIGSVLRLVLEGMGYGIFLLSVPALLSALTCWIIKRELILKRMLFLSFAGCLVYAIFYVFSIVFGGLNLSILGKGNIIYVAYGLVFVTWLFIARIIFGLKYSSLLFALVQLIYNAMFLAASGLIAVGNDPLTLMLKVYFSSFVFLMALYAIFILINAPMKRNFGISSTDAVTMFFAQWFKQSRELEGIFDTVGEDIETIVGVMAFKAGDKLKAVFVVPYLHYGPFGNLGGSEFPALIGSAMSSEYKSSVFVFHGTATHDFNPVSSDDVNIVLDSCRGALKNMTYEKTMAKLTVGKHGSCRAYILSFNDLVFLSLTRAPRTTEDIDFSLGLAYMKQAIAHGARNALVVDCHNAETGEIMKVESGNPISFEFMNAIDDAFSSDGKPAKFRMGVGEDDVRDFGYENGIAGNGIKTCVFQMNSCKHAIVLIDGNSIVPGFRRELLDRILSIGITDCELYTTDTHAVNTVNGVLNPIGLKKKTEITNMVLRTVELALENMEEVEVGMQANRIKMRVFGVNQSSELVGTVNSVVAIARIIVPLILIATVLTVLWGLTKI